jgi:phage terminase large subunit
MSVHQDNPRYYQGGELTPDGAAYLSLLGSLTGVRRQRYLLGLWVAAEGLVYELWDADVHVTDRWSKSKPPPSDWPRLMGVDFGFRNPFACGWFALAPDNQLVLYREIYRTQRLVEDHAADILAASKGDVFPRRVVCDHDAEDRATLERHLGCATVPAIKAVSEGIQAVSERLKLRADGTPGLLVCQDTLVSKDRALVEARKPLCFLDEVVGYVWDERPVPGGGNARDVPLKADDHACDMARYVCAEVDRGVRPRLRVLPL